MTEQEAQDVLLGKPERERALALVTKALDQGAKMTMFKGHFEASVPWNYTGLLIYLKDDSPYPGERPENRPTTVTERPPARNRGRWW